MKKTLFFLIGLLITASLSYSQVTIADYETINTSFETWDGATFAKVANPDATGNNTSANCAKTETNDQGWGYAGMYTNIGGTVDFTSGGVITMNVYAPIAANVLIKLEASDGSRDAMEVITAVDAANINKWATMSFDFSTNAVIPGGGGAITPINDTYDKLVLIFDAGGFNFNTWYFDDIEGPGYSPQTGEQLVFKVNLPDLTNASINLYDNDDNKTTHTLYNDGTNGDESAKDNLWVSDTLKNLKGQNLLSPAGEGEYTWELVDNGTVIGNLQEVTLIAGSTQDAVHDTVPDLLCKPTHSKPTIDGTIDELWANYKTNNTLISWGTREDDDTDFNATFKTMYDQDSVYFLFEITDQTLNNAHGNSWERDEVNIYLDFNQDGTYDQSYEGETMYIWNDQTGNDTKLGVSAQADVTDGWVLELAIAFDSLQQDYTPEVGNTFGMEFSINDNDGGGRELQASYFSTEGNNAWNTPCLVGNVKFIDFNHIATLSSISYENTAIANFNAATTAYEVKLPAGTTDIPQISVTTTDAYANAEITQASALPGDATIVVTAEDGSTQETYTVSFTLTSTDATLSNILVAGIGISGFDASTTDYSYEVPFGTIEVPEVTVEKSNEFANIAITAATNLPGTTTIKVTAEDGTTEKTYSVEFTIAAEISTDATLNKILVDEVEIADFEASTMTYNIELPFGTTEIPDVSVVTNNLAATAVVTQATALPGDATIVVTAQDETTKLTYTVSFSLASPNTEATLSDIKVDEKSIDGFKADSMEYTINLPSTATEVPTVSATATDATATIAITDAETLADTTVIVVTAQDGSSQKTYKVAFNVAVPEPTYNVTFTIIDTDSSAVAEATVLFMEKTLTTDISGVAKFTQVSVTTDATYTVSKEGYVTAEGKLSVIDKDVELTVKLEKEIIPDPTYTATFTVVDENNTAIENAAVKFLDQTVNTNADGIAEFTEITDTADAAFSVTKDGFELFESTVTVAGADAKVTVQLIALGVNKVQLVNRIYPNPTNGVLTVELSNNIDHGTFELLDLNGKIVQKADLNHISNKITLNVKQEGIYMIRISNNNYHQLSKLVVMF